MHPGLHQAPEGVKVAHPGTAGGHSGLAYWGLVKQIERDWIMSYRTLTWLRAMQEAARQGRPFNLAVYSRDLFKL